MLLLIFVCDVELLCCCVAMRVVALCLFCCFVIRVWGKRSNVRVTAKYVAGCDQDSQVLFWNAINQIEVPAWRVDVHTHKHIVSRQIHDAAALLVPPECKHLRAYTDETIIACSKTRKWYLHSRDRFLRDARRCTIWRFLFGLET